MSTRPTIWIPSIIGVVFLLFGLLLPKISEGFPAWLTYVGLALAFALWILAFLLARKSSTDRPGAGKGGNAKARGIYNKAVGGQGGNAGSVDGGDGGSATVKGRGSMAKGGAGGNG